MHLELTEEQEILRDTTRSFLESEAPLAMVRDLYSSPEGFDREWWRRAAELGWTSLFVPETLGGGSLSGQSTADAVIVAEEIGRLVAPGPFLPINLVASALASAGSDEQQAAVLPGLLDGTTIAAWAFSEPNGQWDTAAIATTAIADHSGVVLDGTKAYVEAVGSADFVLVSARTGSGFTQVLVPANTPGVTVTRGRSLDMTRRFGKIAFDNAWLPASAVVGEVAGAQADIHRQYQLAVALQCAGLVGGTDRTLEFTLEYGRDRVAFGRSIVSFQALKHRIADMAVLLEGSKAVTEALVAAIDDDDASTSRLTSVTKAYVGEHSLDIIDDCVQITGGIGVTWEHDIHLYNRRAAVDRAVLGSPEEHKQRLLVLLDAEGALQ